MRAGMPSVQAGDKLAQKFRDIAWRAHERGRVAGEIDPHRQALDLNALFPIPKRVLRKGFAEGGQDWMWGNWGVRWPIRRVSFAMEQQRVGRTGVKPVAVFRFACASNSRALFRDRARRTRSAAFLRKPGS
jgi:hypothetical protein